MRKHVHLYHSLWWLYVFFPVKLLNDDFTPNIHQITAVVSFFKTIFTLSSLYPKLSFLPSLCISKSGGYYMILSDYQFFHCFDWTQHLYMLSQLLTAELHPHRITCLSYHSIHTILKCMCAISKNVVQCDILYKQKAGLILLHGFFCLIMYLEFFLSSETYMII